MAVDEKALQAQREKNDKLRAQIAAESAKRVAAEQDAHNEVVLAQLEAEEARLQADLAEVKASSKKTAVTAGAALPLEQAREQMEAALARQKAAEDGPSAPDNSVAEQEAAQVPDGGKEK